MNGSPFQAKKPETAQLTSEPSTLDRLLTRDCTKDEFILLYSKLLQERMPDCKVEFSDDTTIRVVWPNSKESTTFLDNLWLKYKNGDEDRAEMIERYVRLVEDLGRIDEAPVVKENIVPVIKDSHFMEFIAGKAAKFLTEHLCGDLWVVYCEDHPERISTPLREEILATGLTESEVRTFSVENLKRILPPAECHGNGPWYLVTAGANYVASLLMIDSIWGQVKDMVDGDIIATVPTRDVLMFTGCDSPEGIKAIRERSAEICSSGPHAVSDTLIIRRDGTWSVFNAN